MKKITKLLATVMCGLLACIVLVGCQSNNSSSSSSSNNSSEQLEEKVVVYSTHPEKLLTQVADAFKAETGVEVEFINLKGSLADRIKSEKANPQADVMYGGSTTVFTELAKEDCFEATSPSWASELESEYKDSSGKWYATIKTPIMMFYNTEMMSEADAPKNYKDLSDSKYANNVVTRDNNSSSQREWICNMIYTLSNNGSDMNTAQTWLNGLATNTKSYYNSGSMMFKAVGNKEAAIGVSTLNDIQDNKTKNSLPLQEIDSSDGNVVALDCVAALKGAQHSKAAAKFVEFCGRADIAAKLATDQSRIPTLKSALKDSPSWMQTDIKMMTTDTDAVASKQSEWLELWNNSAYDSSKVIASS